MRFSHKIRKLLNRDAYDSAKATLLRFFYPLDARPFIEAVDTKAFNAIKERYHDPNDFVSPKKYLDLQSWMRTNVKRIRDLRIKKAPPRLRILDIGCGSGYFLHIARCLGHDVLGLDIDREPIFRETISLLGLKRSQRLALEELANPPLARLAPARMVDFGIHVRVEAVFLRRRLVPGRRRLLLREPDLHDRLDALEAVLPRHHEPQRRAVLVRQRLAVQADRENRQRVHGLVHPQAFDVRPVEHGRAAGPASASDP